MSETRTVKGEDISVLWRAAEESAHARRRAMPSTQAALVVMVQAHQRLKDMGWRDGIYAPKDGTVFQVIENGSTGIFDCYYSGEWPDGFWNVMDGGDIYPTSSTPVLFKLKPDTSKLTTKHGG